MSNIQIVAERMPHVLSFFFFQAEDGIRDIGVTGVQTCALPISSLRWSRAGSTAERNLTTSGARPATRQRRALKVPRTSPAGGTTAVCTRTATTEPTTGAPSAARYRTKTPAL